MSEPKLPEDFNDEDLFREVFNKGYDAGYAEGYERGKADVAISARTLVKHLTSNFDDVLSVADVLETLEALEAVAKGE